MHQGALLLERTQHDLRHSVSLRKRKLQELYHATCATADAFWRSAGNATSTPPTRKHTDESEFLDVSDIEKGHDFDIEILRRLPGAGPLFQRTGVPAPKDRAGQSTPTLSLPNQGPLLRASLDSTPPARGGSAQDRRGGDGRAQDHKGSTLPTVPANGLDPRSPVSLGEFDNGRTDDVVREDAQEMSNRAIGKTATPKASPELQHNGGTPVTPPAEAHDRITASKSVEVPDAPAKMPLPPQDQQLNNSTPESQLLLEAAQSQTRTTGLPGPSHPPDQGQSAAAAPGAGLASQGQSSTGSADVDFSKSTAVDRSGAPERSPKPPPKFPMQINTSIARQQTAVGHATSAASTPSSSAQPDQASPPARMRTRVVSGAIRHKSVSEILGETPRSSSAGAHDRTPSMDKSTFSPLVSSPVSRRQSQASATPDASSSNRRFSEIRDKDKSRSQLSTVVFTKPQNEQREGVSRALQVRKGPYDGIDDYLLPLFVVQAGYNELTQLINSSRKSLSTSDFNLYMREMMNCRLLKKIYVLQNNGKWSLRQYERQPEPERPATQWDALLAEMKWMRTDFREERKWKTAVSRNLARACADWVAADPNGRKAMQVKAKAPKLIVGKTIDGASEGNQSPAHESADSTPALMSPADGDSSEDEIMSPLPPATVFSLGPDDVAFAIDDTPVGTKLLSELPLYDPLATLQKRADGVLAEGIDGDWRKSLTNVSKWNDSRIVYEEEPPRKRRRTGRLDYAADEEMGERQQALPPEMTNVAMFRPENRHLLHRLHQTHAFRMPTGADHQLPSQAFFEYRQSSHWTREDDEQLRRRVREYAFNWPLISQTMSSSSQYASGAERRTPWECFERWEAMEGVPQEYARHEYFKRWQTRKHNAEQKQEEVYHAQQQASNAAPPQSRRRTSKPISVERRKNNRYQGLFLAMHKYAKKKEQQQAKQQQMASVAASRKHSEPQLNAQRMRTPAEFSAHKFKQEQERHRMLRAEYAHKAAMASNRANYMASHSSMPYASQVNRAGVPANGAYPHVPSSSVPVNGVNGHARPMPPGHGMMNGMVTNGGKPANMPQGQIANYRAGQGNSADSARIMAEASRMEQQQRLIAAQHRQYPANPAGVGAHGMNAGMQQQQQQQQQQNVFAATNQQQAGKLSPAVNGPRPVSSSPHSGAVVGPGQRHTAQQLSSGVVPTINYIYNELKKKSPNASDEELRRLATQQLNMQINSQRAGANNAIRQVPPNQTGQQHGNSNGTNNSGVGAGPQSNSMARPVQYYQGVPPAPYTGNGGDMAVALNAYSAAVRMQTQQQSGSQGTGQQNGATSNGSSQNGITNGNNNVGGPPNGAPRPESRGMTATPQNRGNTATPTSGSVVVAASNGAAPSQSPRPPSTQAQTGMQQ